MSTQDDLIGRVNESLGQYRKSLRVVQENKEKLANDRADLNAYISSMKDLSALLDSELDDVNATSSVTAVSKTDNSTTVPAVLSSVEITNDETNQDDISVRETAVSDESPVSEKPARKTRAKKAEIVEEVEETPVEVISPIVENTEDEDDSPVDELEEDEEVSSPAVTEDEDDLEDEDFDAAPVVKKSSTKSEKAKSEDLDDLLNNVSAGVGDIWGSDDDDDLFGSSNKTPELKKDLFDTDDSDDDTLEF